MKLEPMIEEYIEHMEIEQNRSLKTISNYRHYLTRLVDFAGDIDVAEITPDLIRKWRLWLNRLGTNNSDELQKNTQNYHLIALRSFLKYCSKRDLEVVKKCYLNALGSRQFNFICTNNFKISF